MTRMTRFAWGPWLVALAMAACENVPVDGPPVVGRSLAALQTAESCDDVLAMLKQKTVADMEALLDQQVEWLLGADPYYGCWAYEDGNGMPVPGATQGGGGRDKASEYSTTNTQEKGVDEADFMKNDAEFIYVLTADGNDGDGKPIGSLQILDAWPAEQTRRIARFPIEGSPTAMYVSGDRAVVYSGLGALNPGGYDDYGPMYYYGNVNTFPGGGLCTYGYDCEFTGDGQRLKITVLELSKDRTQATLLREIEFSGSYLNSRRIDGIVHSVVVFPEMTLPGVSYWPAELEEYRWWCGGELPFTDAQIVAMFEELKVANRAIIEAADIGDFLPSIEDTRYVGGEPIVESGLLGDCDGFYLSQAGDGSAFLSLVSFDLGKQGPIGVSTIVGKPGAVYATPGSFYVAERHYQWEMQGRGWYFAEGEEATEATTVHKFRINDGEAESVYVGSGAAKGRVLNQFSMDEHEGHLRIATTMGHVPDPDVYSTVSVLKEQDGELVVVGLVDRIAPTEDIRSARFDGEKGFLVTFKKTDPLFTLDLSDPVAPRIVGELKIPGYSTYMHLLDETHILSIGFDADDHGDFAYFDGLLLQIFDVADLATPLLTRRQVIGTRGSTSDAATNHLAFNYFASRKVLGVPIVVCEGGDDGSYGTTMSFSGLQVWRVDIDQGFTLLGGIPHNDAPVTGDDYWSVCGTWWSQANSQVKRSVFMEDWAYSIAPTKVRVAPLDDLGNPVATVDLSAP